MTYGSSEQRQLQADLTAALKGYLLPQIQSGKPYRDFVAPAVTEVLDQLARLIAPINDPDARIKITMAVAGTLPQLVEDRRAGALDHMRTRMAEFGATVQ